MFGSEVSHHSSNVIFVEILATVEEVLSLKEDRTGTTSGD
jgi:hypothetical protein